MTDNIPTRIRVSPDDLPRWAAIRDHIRTDLQSRPGVHRIANPLDSRIVGEMLVVLTQFYRLPDPGFRYSDGPAAGDDAKVRQLMVDWIQTGHEIEAMMNRVMRPNPNEDEAK